MRDLHTVILQMLGVIPEDMVTFRRKISDFLQRPDEIESWNDLGDLLYQEVFSDFYPEISWQSDLEKIWIGDDEPETLDYSNF